MQKHHQHILIVSLIVSALIIIISKYISSSKYDPIQSTVPQPLQQPPLQQPPSQQPPSQQPRIFEIKTSLFYKDDEYMVTISIGGRTIDCVVDTGSISLMVANTLCTTCNQYYGSYEELEATPINIIQKYVSQNVTFSWVVDAMKISDQIYPKFIFGSIDDIKINKAQYKSYNVLGLAPISNSNSTDWRVKTFWEQTKISKFSFNFNQENPYLKFNSLENNVLTNIPYTTSSTKPYFMITWKLNGFSLLCMIDTGFSKTLIPDMYYNQLKSNQKSNESSLVTIEFPNNFTYTIELSESTSEATSDFSFCIFGNMWMKNLRMNFDLTNKLYGVGSV